MAVERLTLFIKANFSKYDSLERVRLALLAKCYSRKKLFLQ